MITELSSVRGKKTVGRQSPLHNPEKVFLKVQGRTGTMDLKTVAP